MADEKDSDDDIDDLPSFDGMEDEFNERAGFDKTSAEVAEQLSELNGNSSEGDRVDVSIFKEDCLKCSHLCQNMKGTKKFECTEKNGNKKCPAQWIQITVGVDIEKLANKIYRAQYDGDMEKLSRRLKRLEKYSPEIRRKVLYRVSEKTLAK